MVLAVLDGVGYCAYGEGNMVNRAKDLTLDRLTNNGNGDMAGHTGLPQPVEIAV